MNFCNKLTSNSRKICRFIRESMCGSRIKFDGNWNKPVNPRWLYLVTKEAFLTHHWTGSSHWLCSCFWWILCVFWLCAPSRDLFLLKATWDCRTWETKLSLKLAFVGLNIDGGLRGSTPAWCLYLLRCCLGKASCFGCFGCCAVSVASSPMLLVKPF